MTTIFRYDIRVLMCQSCGAAIEASPRGGAVQCSYCRSQHQLVQRKEEPVEPAAAARPINEGQRLTMLRQQDGRPLVPPPAIQALLEGGTLPAWKVQEAIQIWQGARRQLESSSSPEAAENLLFLTMILSNHFSEQNDKLKQRAMFESALDVFTLPRHRQMMRGALARFAALEQDVNAAEQWLEPCNPRSEDLQADTAYRISRATIDTARGDFNAVLKALGPDAQQVPIMDAMEAIAVVLRANAWERLGQPQAAAGQLAQYMGSGGPSGRMALTKVREAFARSNWQMAPAAFQAATAHYSQAAGHSAAAGAGGVVGKVFYWLGLLQIIGGVLFGLGTLVAVALSFPDMEAIMGWGMGLGITAFTLLLMGGIFFAVGRGIAGAAAKAQRLRVHGIPAQGRIQGVQPTGMLINNVPQVAITVTVQLPNQAPYQATTKMLLQPMAMAQLAPGTSVSLRVDPQNPREILIETD